MSAERYLAFLEENSFDLCCHNRATGGDDFDIVWTVVGHWKEPPMERILGYGSTAVAAILDAMEPPK